MKVSALRDSIRPRWKRRFSVCAKCYNSWRSLLSLCMCVKALYTDKYSWYKELSAVRILQIY